jgi:hypothetical protein
MLDSISSGELARERTGKHQVEVNQGGGHLFGFCGAELLAVLLLVDLYELL